MAKSPIMAVRVPPQYKTQFLNLASRYGGAAHVMRELIVAFCENRVEIAAPKNPLYKEK